MISLTTMTATSALTRCDTDRQAARRNDSDGEAQVRTGRGSRYVAGIAVVVLTLAAAGFAQAVSKAVAVRGAVVASAAR